MEGYAGKILYIDLSSGSTKVENLSEELALKFIGGMGINSYLAYKLIKKGIDPLSPENVLIFGAGPFVGTLVPAGSRTEVCAKSPITGFFGSASGGKGIAQMLKYAGYDNLVVTGCAKSPVYIYISDDKVEIKDAEFLWGKDVFETTDTLKEIYPESYVSTIGPFGERLIRYAAIIDNKESAFSRCGLGAVMGSKNLKAIVVFGKKGIKIHDKKRFFEIVDPIRDRMVTSKATPLWRRYGFSLAFPHYASMGFFVKNNFSKGFLELEAKYDKEEFANDVSKGVYACLSCPLGCKEKIKIDGISYKISSLPSQVGYHIVAGIESWQHLAKLCHLENRFGVDSTSLCGTIGFAIELYRKGILKREDVGFSPDWGYETFERFFEMIKERKGIGKIMGEGSFRMAKELGGEAMEFLVEVKGLEMPLGVRGRLSTENFGQFTNPRGGHLDRSPSISFMPGRKRETYIKYCKGIGVPDDAIDAVTKGPDNFDVARLTKWVEDYNSLQFSLGICHRTPIAQMYNLETLLELFKATTGLYLEKERFRLAGERIFNIQSLFNAREGIGKDNFMPSKKILTEPLPMGDRSFPPIDRKNFEKILDTYFLERGWENGVPKKEKLKELEIEYL